MSKIIYIGIDVSKASLQIDLEEKSIELKNTIAGITDLIARLHELEGSSDDSKVHAVLEPTGGYELLVMVSLQAAGFEVIRVNAKQVRHFAYATNVKAKTDKIDARLLTVYGQTVRPEPSTQLDKDQLALKERVERREQIVVMLRMEKNRLETNSDKFTIKSVKNHSKKLEAELERVEEGIQELISENETFKHRAEVLTGQKGIGKITAASLIARMPELGTLKRGQAGALAGLAPYNRDSGSSIKGKRYTNGGRAAVRRSLYMAALSCVNYEPQFRLFFNRLRAAGKAFKVAIAAVMRKLIERCNTLLKPQLHVAA